MDGLLSLNEIDFSNEITPRTEISPISMNELLVLKTTRSLQAAPLQIIVPTFSKLEVPTSILS